MKMIRTHQKRNKIIIKKMARGLRPDSGWLEDFDPIAAGSRTSTRVVFTLTRARALADRRARGLGPKHHGHAPGKYNGDIEWGNKTETKWKNEKK